MRSRILIISFLASLPFWIGLNIFADNLFALNDSPEVLLAQTRMPEYEKQDNLEIGAKAAASILIDKDGNEKIIFEKNSGQRLPIASLTKIMSSYIILENIDLSQNIAMDEKLFKGIDLFYASYIESDNKGYASLADKISVNGFVELMNLEAEYLGLKDTYFFNPTGVDQEEFNFSTAKDLSKITAYYFKKPLASHASLIKMFNLYTSDGVFHHRSINTNEMLDYYKKFGNYEIIGGKTGYTPMASGCLVLALEDKESQNILINVILGSEDRFKDMEKMVNWAVASK